MKIRYLLRDKVIPVSGFLMLLSVITLLFIISGIKFENMIILNSLSFPLSELKKFLIFLIPVFYISGFILYVKIYSAYYIRKAV